MAVVRQDLEQVDRIGLCIGGGIHFHCDGNRYIRAAEVLRLLDGHALGIGGFAGGVGRGDDGLHEVIARVDGLALLQRRVARFAVAAAGFGRRIPCKGGLGEQVRAAGAVDKNGDPGRIGNRVAGKGTGEARTVRVAVPVDRRRRLGDGEVTGDGQAPYCDAGRVGARQGGRSRAEVFAGLAVPIIDFDCRDRRAAPGGLLAGIYPCVLTIRAVRCVLDFKPHKTAVTVFSTYGIYGGHRAAGSDAFGPDHIGRCGELPVVVVAVEMERSVVLFCERVPLVLHVGGEDLIIVLPHPAGGDVRAGFALGGDADSGLRVQGPADGDGLACG